jgi:hypothetical protein
MQAVTAERSSGNAVAFAIACLTRPCLGIQAARMERLWSQAGATGSNPWQMRTLQKRRKQAKTAAAGCHWLRPNLDGKEGVDGSSPSEGFTKGQQMAFFAAGAVYANRSIVHQPIPKIGPQHLGSPGVWLEQRHLTASSTSFEERALRRSGLMSSLRELAQTSAAS